MIPILLLNDPLPAPEPPAEALMIALERLRRAKSLLKDPLRVTHVAVEELDDEALEDLCFYEALMWAGAERSDSVEPSPDSLATMLLKCSPIKDLRERTRWDDRFLVQLAVSLMGLFAAAVAAFAAFVLPHLPWIGPRIERFFAACWAILGW